MKTTVFGATGAIGMQVVEQLRCGGHTLTAYVRSPAKVPATWGEEVTVVVGEITDADAVDRAVAGADAVVSALGPSMSRTATGLPLVAGTEHIVAAMGRHSVHRYVGLATPSVLDPRESPTWQTRLSTFLARTFLPGAYEEMVGMSRAVMASSVDWTIVRFASRRNGPAGDRLRTGFFGHDRLGFAVTRADIATFTATQVDDPRHVGAAPAISN